MAYNSKKTRPAAAVLDMEKVKAAVANLTAVPQRRVRPATTLVPEDAGRRRILGETARRTCFYACADIRKL